MLLSVVNAHYFPTMTLSTSGEPAPTHHIYGPSTHKNRAICPGWQNDADSDKAHADEGTLLHKATETGVLDGLNEEQKDCVTSCLRYVGRLEQDAVEVHKEVRLSILGGLTFGTSDRVIVRRAAGKLHLDVVDFKFGRNSVDEASVNLQGWNYVLGAFDLYPAAESATVHFVLPRRDEIDTHTFRRADYPRLALAVKLVIERAALFSATGDESMLNPTPQNCLYCGRKVSCSKVRTFALSVAQKYAPLEVVEEVHSSAVTNPAQMAKLYDAAKVMEKFAESVKKHALSMALEAGGALYDESGKALYEIAERDGTRKIKDLGLALPVLLKHLDDREILSAADVSLPAVLKLIGAKAPRGEKTKLIGAVEAELAAAEAVSQGTGTRYLRRVKE